MLAMLVVRVVLGELRQGLVLILREEMEAQRVMRVQEGGQATLVKEVYLALETLMKQSLEVVPVVVLGIRVVFLSLVSKTK
ncbi:MAG: hypothetical protein CMI60_05335 [Parvibaculum sp.]|nr:hypothetical protein [Parvibaculum sp.]